MSVASTDKTPLEAGTLVVWRCATCRRVEGATEWPATIHAAPHDCPAKPLEVVPVVPLPVPPEYDRSVVAGGIGRSTKEFNVTSTDKTPQEPG